MNVPARGFGARSLELLREARARHGVSLVDGGGTAREGRFARGPAGNGAPRVLRIVERLAESEEGGPLDELVGSDGGGVGPRRHYAKEKGERRGGEDREPERAHQRGAALPGPAGPRAGPGGRPRGPAPRCLRPPHGTGSGRGAGGRARGQRAAHDPARGQGSRVPRGISLRMEEGLFPHQRSLENPRPTGRGAPALLRGNDPREAAGSTSRTRRAGGCTGRIPIRVLRGSCARSRPSCVEDMRFTALRQGSRAHAAAAGRRHGGGGPRWAASRAERRPGKPASRPAFHFALGQRVRHGEVRRREVVLSLDGDGAHARIHVNFAGRGREVAGARLREPRSRLSGAVRAFRRTR